MSGLAVGGRVRTKIVRAAANLGIGAVELTSGIRCFSARKVGFMLTATDANTIAGAVIQVCNDDVGYTTIDASGFGVGAVGTVTGVVLNAGGRWLIMVPNGAASTGRFAFANPWFFARLQLTGGAAITAGLRVDAYSWDDLDFAINAQGLPPAVVS